MEDEYDGGQWRVSEWVTLNRWHSRIELIMICWLTPSYWPENGHNPKTGIQAPGSPTKRAISFAVVVVGSLFAWPWQHVPSTDLHLSRTELIRVAPERDSGSNPVTVSLRY